MKTAINRSTQDTQIESKKNQPKEVIEIGQSFFKLLRDASLSTLFIALLIAPRFLNERLIKAGFEEGSVAGFKWKKQLKETDAKLVEAAKQIDDLKQRLRESNSIISKISEENPQSQSQKSKEQIIRNESSTKVAETVNSEIQTTLESNTPILNPDVRESQLNALSSIINDYKIVIFYNQNKPSQKSVAAEIKKALMTADIKSDIQIKPKNYEASNNQIRYYAKTEREAAYALQSILIDTYTKQNFKLQTVYTPTPNYISIFLAS